jgi:2-polyprenyl-3-methyl-5-hydroxy-6-metoxy-1,4-benzoquinol methylase
MNLFIERKTCPICKSKKTEEIITRTFQDQDFVEFTKLESTYKTAFYADFEKGVVKDQIFKVVKCLQCKFLYQQYVLNDEGMSRLYNVWMDHTVVEALSGGPQVKQKAIRYFQDRVFYVQNHFKQKKINILDWGAGLGTFCIAAKNVNTGDVYAYDFSSEKNKHLEQLGVITKPLEELPKKYFHFINIDQVLEHVSDPLDLLDTAAKHLTDDGVIFISVPLCNTVEKSFRNNILDKKAFEQLQPHQHINAFTNKTLKAIGKEAGLKTLFEPFKQISASSTKGYDLKEHAKNIIKPFYRQWISTALYFQKT